MTPEQIQAALKRAEKFSRISGHNDSPFPNSSQDILALCNHLEGLEEQLAEAREALIGVDEFEQWSQDGGYIDLGEVEDQDDRFRCVQCAGRGATPETVRHSPEKGHCYVAVVARCRKALAAIDGKEEKRGA